MQLRDKAEYEYEEVVTGHINDFRDKRHNLGARSFITQLKPPNWVSNL